MMGGDNDLDLKALLDHASEAIVKNPLPATLWFLRHDATTGLLEENGFVLSQDPDYDQPLYTKDGFFLFAQGFWYNRGSHQLVYRNPSRSFYRLSLEKNPMGIPGKGEERVRLEEGFRQVEHLLTAHEEFVAQKMGSGYRPGLIQRMPRAEQRYAKNWKVVFSCERRSVTM
jgi:hypothetical protein